MTTPTAAAHPSRRSALRLAALGGAGLVSALALEDAAEGALVGERLIAPRAYAGTPNMFRDGRFAGRWANGSNVTVTSAPSCGNASGVVLLTGRPPSGIPDRSWIVAPHGEFCPTEPVQRVRAARPAAGGLGLSLLDPGYTYVRQYLGSSDLRTAAGTYTLTADVTLGAMTRSTSQTPFVRIGAYASLRPLGASDSQRTPFVNTFGSRKLGAGNTLRGGQRYLYQCTFTVPRLSGSAKRPGHLEMAFLFLSPAHVQTANLLVRDLHMSRSSAY